jgi:BTB/POZ domain-containing protein 3/6
MSPPHNNNNNNSNNNGSMMQRELITQPNSQPQSPLPQSPGALSSTSFCLQSSTSNNNTNSVIDTADPNWQATKASVRERNAAMFNNELMADVKFIVGSEGKIIFLSSLGSNLIKMIEKSIDFISKKFDKSSH